MDPLIEEMKNLAEKVKETMTRTIEVDDTEAWDEALAYRDYRGPRKCPTKEIEITESTESAEQAIDMLVQLLTSESTKVALQARAILARDYPEHCTRTDIMNRLEKAYQSGPKQLREVAGELLGYSRLRIWFRNLFSR